jgi:UPF0755 protein
MRLRLTLSVIAFGVIATASATAWWYRTLWGVRSGYEVVLDITPGATAQVILDELAETSLLPSPRAGRAYLLARASGRSLHWGHYVVPAGSRPVDVLEMLLEGRVEMFEVTVVEGTDAATISDQFISQGVGTAGDWAAIIDSPAWIADLVPDAPSLEGFLFPDTYRFAVGASAETVARHLVDRFAVVWREEVAGVDAPWGTPLEIVTLASLVEAETSLDSERGLIAGVFLNRLRRGMLLQCDPTVIYTLKRKNAWQGHLLRIHWEIDDPYNTYRYPGLPPGPINSPGRAALASAVVPEPTEYLYFVAQPGGGHTFSRTLTEHNRAVARLLSSRR